MCWKETDLVKECCSLMQKATCGIFCSVSICQCIKDKRTREKDRGVSSDPRIVSELFLICVQKTTGQNSACAVS